MNKPLFPTVFPSTVDTATAASIEAIASVLTPSELPLAIEVMVDILERYRPLTRPIGRLANADATYGPHVYQILGHDCENTAKYAILRKLVKAGVVDCHYCWNQDCPCDEWVARIFEHWQPAITYYVNLLASASDTKFLPSDENSNLPPRLN